MDKSCSRVLVCLISTSAGGFARFGARVWDWLIDRDATFGWIRVERLGFGPSFLFSKETAKQIWELVRGASRWRGDWMSGETSVRKSCDQRSRLRWTLGTRISTGAYLNYLTWGLRERRSVDDDIC